VASIRARTSRSETNASSSLPPTDTPDSCKMLPRATPNR